MFNIKLFITGIISFLLVSCGTYSNLLQVADNLTKDIQFKAQASETTYFQLSESSLVVSNIEQSLSSISFTTKETQSWRVVSSNSFCTFKNTKTEGVGSSTISIFLTENKEVDSRICSINFTVPGLFPAPVLTIRQMGVTPFISINTSSIIIPDTSPYSIIVISNTNWSATTSVSWCKISKSNEVPSNRITGSGTLQVSIQLEANAGSNIRNCLLSFKADNILPIQSNVTQFGRNDTLIIRNTNIVPIINTNTTSLTESSIRSLSNSTNNISLASNVRNYMFNLTTNVPYTVTIPELQSLSPLKQWVRVDSSSKAGNGNTSSNINLVLQPNTTDTGRRVEVVITAGTVQQTITVFQRASSSSPYITLSSNQFNALSMSTEVSVNVESSTGWRAVVTDSIGWCKVSSTSNSFTVNASPNTAATSRVCRVNVSTVTGGVSSIFTLTQLGSVPNILINSTDPINVSHNASLILEKVITSNIDYTVSNNNSTFCYLPLTNYYSTGVDIPLVVSLSANSRNVARSCTITISTAGSDSQQFIINQAAKPGVLNVSARSVTLLPTVTTTTIIVDSTVDWTATKTSGAGTCTIEPARSIRDTENVTISGFPPNNNATSLNACTIIFSGIAGGVTYSQTVSVTQLGTNASLSLSSTTGSISYNQNSSDFSLTSNASWSITSLSNTCTVATVETPSTALTNGLAGNHSLRIAFISTEPSVTERTCTATFTTTSGVGTAASQTYTLTKAQTPTITLSSPTLDVASMDAPASFPVTLATASETIAITFKSNVAWSISSNQAYCVVDVNNNSGASGGNSDITKNISVLANPGTTNRTCALTFSGTNAVDKTLTLTQYGNTLLVGDSSDNVFSKVYLLVRRKANNTLEALGNFPSVQFSHNQLPLSVNSAYSIRIAAGTSAKFRVASGTIETNTDIGCGGGVTEIVGSASATNTELARITLPINTFLNTRTCGLEFTSYSDTNYSGTTTTRQYTLTQEASSSYIKTNTNDLFNVTNPTVSKTATSVSYKARWIIGAGYGALINDSSHAAMGCTVSPATSDNSEQNITVSFTANGGPSRSCTINFGSRPSDISNRIYGRRINSGETIGTINSPQQNLTITQEAGTVFIREAGNDNNLETVTVSSVTNTSFRVEAPGGYTSSVTNMGDAGCTVSPTSTSSGVISSVTVSFNSPRTSRSCRIGFTSKTNGDVNSINIIQQDPIVDTDGDGLINISRQSQFLNMQYNLSGTSYKTFAADSGITNGCPNTGCIGYELDNEIKFGFLTTCTPFGISFSNNEVVYANSTGLNKHTTVTGGGQHSVSRFSNFIRTNPESTFSPLASFTIADTSYGYNISSGIRVAIFIQDFSTQEDGNCNANITQPSTALTGFSGIFRGNNFNVSGMRINNGNRVTSASTYFPSGTIESAPFR